MEIVKSKLRTLGQLGAGIAVLGLVVAGCAGAAASPTPAPRETISIAIHPWVGYEANAAVVGYLLENELGYKVDKKVLKEDVTWAGFETGEVDVILENWGHPELQAKYIDEKKVAVNVGPTGNVGIIAWYVPGWLATEHPEVLSWENLNKYAEKFKTSESGSKGQFLASDPTFVTFDEALVANLKLDFKVVYSGSEAATIKSFQQAEAQKQWLIGYFWDPHWIHSQIDMVRVALPAWTDGCDADVQKVACDYPDYVLDKIVRKKLADSNSPAFQLIRNFTWTNDDQNLVSDYITNQGMTPAAAGEKWVRENEAAWKAWMP
jgi:glycine betaine/proline transport system substrate-binding protein